MLMKHVKAQWLSHLALKKRRHEADIARLREDIDRLAGHLNTAIREKCLVEAQIALLESEPEIDATPNGAGLAVKARIIEVLERGDVHA